MSNTISPSNVKMNVPLELHPMGAMIKTPKKQTWNKIRTLYRPNGTANKVLSPNERKELAKKTEEEEKAARSTSGPGLPGGVSTAGEGLAKFVRMFFGGGKSRRMKRKSLKRKTRSRR